MTFNKVNKNGKNARENRSILTARPKRIWAGVNFPRQGGLGGGGIVCVNIIVFSGSVAFDESCLNAGCGDSIEFSLDLSRRIV